MKNILSISSIVENAVNNHKIPYMIALDDASKLIANAKGSYKINTDIFYSSRVIAYQKDDQIISFGKKNLNVDEMRRQLEKLIGKGCVTIWVNNQILKGDLVK